MFLLIIIGCYINRNNVKNNFCLGCKFCVYRVGGYYYRLVGKDVCIFGRIFILWIWEWWWCYLGFEICFLNNKDKYF